MLVLHLKRYELTISPSDIRTLKYLLSRYDYEQGNRSMKISRPVSIPSVLNLTQLVAEDVKLPENTLVERLLKIRLYKRHSFVENHC